MDFDISFFTFCLAESDFNVSFLLSAWQKAILIFLFYFLPSRKQKTFSLFVFKFYYGDKGNILSHTCQVFVKNFFNFFVYIKKTPPILNFKTRGVINKKHNVRYLRYSSYIIFTPSSISTLCFHPNWCNFDGSVSFFIVPSGLVVSK